MMRYFFPIILLGILVSGPAGASSVTLLKRVDKPISPSIIYFGEPEPSAAPSPDLAAAADGQGGSVVVLSPSVIALGEPQDGVEFGQVASIGNGNRQRPRNPHLPPMVIRGGISGDAFSRPGDPAIVAPEEASPQTSSAPSDPAQPQQPQQPEPVLPPAAPTDRPE